MTSVLLKAVPISPPALFHRPIYCIEHIHEILLVTYMTDNFGSTMKSKKSVLTGWDTSVIQERTKLRQ